MDNLPSLVRRSRIVPILAAGGIGFVVQLALFELLVVYLGLLSASLSTIVSAEAGILVNFFINDRISFRHRMHKLPLTRRLVRHQGVVLVAVALQWTCVFAAEQFSPNLLVIHAALFVGIGLGLIWNASWYHHFVWRHDISDTPPKPLD